MSVIAPLRHPVWRPVVRAVSSLAWWATSAVAAAARGEAATERLYMAVQRRARDWTGADPVLVAAMGLGDGASGDILRLGPHPFDLDRLRAMLDGDDDWPAFVAPTTPWCEPPAQEAPDPAGLQWPK